MLDNVVKSLFLASVCLSCLMSCSAPDDDFIGVTALSVGDNAYIALREDDSIKAYATYHNGFLDSGSRQFDNVVQVEAGVTNSGVVLADGSVNAWGHTASLDEINQAKNVAKLSLGFAGGLALHKDNSVSTLVYDQVKNYKFDKKIVAIDGDAGWVLNEEGELIKVDTQVGVGGMHPGFKYLNKRVALANNGDLYLLSEFKLSSDFVEYKDLTQWLWVDLVPI